MKKRELKIGDVVQIDPAHDECFGGAFMMVTEPRAWGAQGFVHYLNQGRAYYRVPFENMEFVGHATWVPQDEQDTPEQPSDAPSSPEPEKTP